MTVLSITGSAYNTGLLGLHTPRRSTVYCCSRPIRCTRAVDSYCRRALTRPRRSGSRSLAGSSSSSARRPAVLMNLPSIRRPVIFAALITNASIGVLRRRPPMHRISFLASRSAGAPCSSCRCASGDRDRPLRQVNASVSVLAFRGVPGRSLLLLQPRHRLVGANRAAPFLH